MSAGRRCVHVIRMNFIVGGMRHLFDTRRRAAVGAVCCALSSVCIPTLRAQTPSSSSRPASAASVIEVGDDRAVDVGKAQLPLTEPHLAANPRDAGHLVASVIVVKKPDLTERSCSALASFDAGRTWKTHDFEVKACGDPYAAILDDGTALVAMLGTVADTTHLFVFRSPDGGLTWSERPVVLPGQHDHGTLVVDRSAGALAGNVYAVSQGSARDAAGKRRQATMVARSTDGGVTFAPATPIIHGNLWMTAMNPVVSSDGMLVVPWANFGRIMADGEFAWLARELDWMVASTDGGGTFATPLFVSDACGRTFPVLATDGSSGPYRDRLYWLCNDRTFEHLYLHYSADRGARWSEPVVVNQGAGREPYARTAAIAVNRNGVVGITWYDGRADKTGDVAFRCQELFFTASLDGGRSFLPDVRVSSAKNCPVTSANGEAGRRWPAGGDYHGLVAAADGRFQVLWSDSRSGVYQLRAATIRVNGAAVAGGK
jgi:hypothetical protein